MADVMNGSMVVGEYVKDGAYKKKYLNNCGKLITTDKGTFAKIPLHLLNPTLAAQVMSEQQRRVTLGEIDCLDTEATIWFEADDRQQQGAAGAAPQRQAAQQPPARAPRR